MYLYLPTKSLGDSAQPVLSLAALRRLRAACLFVEDKTQAGPSAA